MAQFSVQCIPVYAAEGERLWVDVTAQTVAMAAIVATRRAERWGMTVATVSVYPHGVGTTLVPALLTVDLQEGE